jgi:hypothetical protein
MNDQVTIFNVQQVEATLPDYVRRLKGGGSSVYADILCLWARIDELTAGTRVNRLSLGETFRTLRDLYSDRNIGGNRRTSRHGTFEKECQRRGHKPRTVRDLISDYEAFLSGKPSVAAKRNARQQRTPTQSLMQAASHIVQLGNDLQALNNLSRAEITKCEVTVSILTKVISRFKESSCRTPQSTRADVSNWACGLSTADYTTWRRKRRLRNANYKARRVRRPPSTDEM